MQNPDTFDRIIQYFHALASESFVYKDKIFFPYRQFVITPLAFRFYICPMYCGACCQKCSLVWPVSQHPGKNILTKKVGFTVNKIEKYFWVYDPSDNKNRMCEFLQLETERCKIYKQRMLPGRLELFKFTHFKSRNKVYGYVKKPGRWSKMKRSNDKVGAMCQLMPYDRKAVKGYIDCLKELQEWMEQFKISNNINAVIKYLSSGPQENSLTIENRRP